MVRAATPASRRGPQSAAPELRGVFPGAGPAAAKTAGRPGAGRRALCCGLRWWGTAGRGAGPGPGACGWEALWGAGARAAAGAMAESGGAARRRAPALLEAARARYESLHISDDVFGESGPDSGGNPFYSTSAASRSSSAASSDDEPERPGPARGPGSPAPGAPAAQESEEDEAGAGWSSTLRDRPPPRFEDTGGKARPGGGQAAPAREFQMLRPPACGWQLCVSGNTRGCRSRALKCERGCVRGLRRLFVGGQEEARPRQHFAAGEDVGWGVLPSLARRCPRVLQRKPITPVGSLLRGELDFTS